jgi:hypothetical protein
MAQNDRASAVHGQSEPAQPRISRLSAVYVTRTPKAHTRPEDFDQLDGILLSCAGTELSLDMLLGQVPCSKRTGLDRVRSLAQRGFLTIHRGSEADKPEQASAPADTAAATPTPHRVFRKPRVI